MREVIKYFEKFKISSKQFLKWTGIFYLFIPLILFLEIFSYLFILLFLIISFIETVMFYKKYLRADKEEEIK